MKLKNTSQFDTAQLRDLMRIATKGVSLADTGVHIKNSKRGYAGRAYYDVRFNSVTQTDYRRLVVIRLGDNKYPYRVSYDWKYKTAPEFWATDWKELFVLIMAHEARHIQQYKKNWKRSEIDAEKFAGKRLAAYRTSLKQETTV